MVARMVEKSMDENTSNESWSQPRMFYDRLYCALMERWLARRWRVKRGISIPRDPPPFTFPHYRTICTISLRFHLPSLSDDAIGSRGESFLPIASKITCAYRCRRLLRYDQLYLRSFRLLSFQQRTVRSSSCETERVRTNF